jgi:hypothetical protein
VAFVRKWEREREEASSSQMGSCILEEDLKSENKQPIRRSK